MFHSQHPAATQWAGQIRPTKFLFDLPLLEKGSPRPLYPTWVSENVTALDTTLAALIIYKL